MRSLLAASLVLVGCSVLVEPTNEVRCFPEVGCPAGFVCEVPPGTTEGVCREMCVPPGMPEECNGRDDDCDGNVDEGLDLIAEECNGGDDDCDGRVDEGHDANSDGTIDLSESFDTDNDGFNRCGTDRCDDPDGDCMIDPDRIDCNDSDDTINPNANEECDATDHDCDGAAFPPGEPTGAECLAPRDTLCGGGQICEVDRGCIPPGCNSGRSCSACGDRQACEGGECVDLDCDPAICEGMNQFCDSSTPDCQDKKANGSDCDRDVECLSGLCVPGNNLGLSVPGICFEACCSDDQCPAGQHCYGPGTGARSCMIPRTDTGRTTIGTGVAGTSCSTGAECRSGRCDGTCFEACGQSSDCPETCGITAEGLGCRSGGEIDDMCTMDSQCALEFCNSSGFCPAQACTSNGSCPSFGGLVAFCTYSAVRLGTLQAVPSCFYAGGPPGFPELPNNAYGGSCDRNYCETVGDCCADPLCLVPVADGCDTGTCINGRCTVTCCDDSTCPGDDVCRPQRVSIEGGTFYPMFCVPPT